MLIERLVSRPKVILLCFMVGMLSACTPGAIMNNSSVDEDVKLDISCLDDNYEDLSATIVDFEITDEQYDYDFNELYMTSVIDYAMKDTSQNASSLQEIVVNLDDGLFSYPISVSISQSAATAAIINENPSSYTLELLSFNYLSNTDDVLVLSPINNTNMIYEATYGETYIYWIEASTDYDKSIDTWTIYCKELETDKYVEVDNSTKYENPTLLPRLSTDNNLLAYTVGYDSDGLVHYVKYYNPETEVVSQALKINNIVNPYTIPRIYNNFVLYPDYLDDDWYMIFYDMENDKEYTQKLNFTGESEYPRFFTFRDNCLVYISSLNILRFVDITSSDEYVIDNSVHTAGILEDYIVYSQSGHLLCYDISQKTVKIFDNSEDNYYGYFTQSNDYISILRQSAYDYQLLLLY